MMPKENQRFCTILQGCLISFLYCISQIHSIKVDLNIKVPICVFLDSTKSSLSLEFNKMKCSAKPWAKQWAGSRTFEERFVIASGTSVFGTGLYLKCSGLRMS